MTTSGDGIELLSVLSVLLSVSPLLSGLSVLLVTSALLEESVLFMLSVSLVLLVLPLVTVESTLSVLTSFPPAPRVTLSSVSAVNSIEAGSLEQPARKNTRKPVDINFNGRSSKVGWRDSDGRVPVRTKHCKCDHPIRCIQHTNMSCISQVILQLSRRGKLSENAGDLREKTIAGTDQMQLRLTGRSRSLIEFVDPVSETLKWRGKWRDRYMKKNTTHN